LFNVAPNFAQISRKFLEISKKISRSADRGKFHKEFLEI